MNNNIFSNHRKKIDKIDRQIIGLLEKRLESARKIGEYKRKNKIKIIDRKREKEILNERVNESKLDKNFTKKLFKLMILESRRVQKK